MIRAIIGSLFYRGIDYSFFYFAFIFALEKLFSLDEFNLLSGETEYT